MLESYFNLRSGKEALERNISEFDFFILYVLLYLNNMSYRSSSANNVKTHADSSLICASCYNCQLATDKYTQRRRCHEEQIRKEAEMIHQARQQAEIERQNILQLQQQIIQANQHAGSELNDLYWLRKRKEDEGRALANKPAVSNDSYQFEVKAYRESLLHQMTEKERLKEQERLEALNAERERIRRLQESHLEESKIILSMVDSKRKQLRNDLLRQIKDKTIEKERELHEKAVERQMLEAKVEQYQLERQRVLMEARLRATEYARQPTRETKPVVPTPSHDTLERQKSIWLCGKCSRPTDLRYLSRY
jgi:hypothetical protein